MAKEVVGKPSIADFYKKVKAEVGMDDPKPIPYVIPTGSFALDKAIYIGGYPGGRIIEIYGPEHSGKTTLAMQACVEAQKMGIIPAYIDMETTLDIPYFKRMGIKGEANVDWFHFTPQTGEDVFTTIEKMIDFGAKLIIVDSVAAMVAQAELNGEMGEAFMGLQARMMGQGMRKSVGPASRGEVTIIFINQIRMKIGVVFGNPETTPGGGALKFFASLRLNIAQVGDEINGVDDEGNDGQIGQYSRVKVIKNKVAPPKRVCQVPILWGKGIAKELELLDELILQGFITKSSSYFTYKDVKVNGKEKMVAYVKENMVDLEALISKKLEGQVKA